MIRRYKNIYIERAKSILAKAKGVAAVEFALVVPVFIILFMGLTDLGLAYRDKLRISSAITAASYYAFQNGQDVSVDTAPDLIARTTRVITASLGNSANVKVSVLLNGASDGTNANDYYCVITDITDISGTGSTQNTCSGDIKSGKYLSITVTGQITPVLVSPNLFGDFFDINENIVVRLV